MVRWKCDIQPQPFLSQVVCSFVPCDVRVAPKLVADIAPQPVEVAAAAAPQRGVRLEAVAIPGRLIFATLSS